jgi:hypothetical protein
VTSSESRRGHVVHLALAVVEHKERARREDAPPWLMLIEILSLYQFTN